LLPFLPQRLDAVFPVLQPILLGFFGLLLRRSVSDEFSIGENNVPDTVEDSEISVKPSIDSRLATIETSAKVSADSVQASAVANFMTPPMNDEHSLKDVKGDMDLGSYHSKKMKRRRSSLLLLLGAMLFDEPQQSRRFSLISSLYKPMDNDDDRLDQVLLSFENTEPAYKKPKMNHSVDPNTLKSTMQGFATAMEKSTKSQQEIHDWDRKMGLKRSHSKTMRMSMRSRKKLRTLVKKEINALVVSRNMRFQFPSRVLKRRLAKKPWEKSNRILFLFTASMTKYW
jgi:hypothetical protein